MFVDKGLLEYIKKNNIIPDRIHVGMRWLNDTEYDSLVYGLANGEEKHLLIATSYGDKEKMEECLEAIHKNISKISIIIYHELAKSDIERYQIKYPNITFSLLNDELYSY